MSCWHSAHWWVQQECKSWWYAHRLSSDPTYVCSMTQKIRQGVCWGFVCVCVQSAAASVLHQARIPTGAERVGLRWWMGSLLQRIHPQRERESNPPSPPATPDTRLSAEGGVCVWVCVRVCLFCWVSVRTIPSIVSYILDLSVECYQVPLLRRSSKVLILVLI